MGPFFTLTSSPSHFMLERAKCSPGPNHTTGGWKWVRLTSFACRKDGSAGGAACWDFQPNTPLTVPSRSQRGDQSGARLRQRVRPLIPEYLQVVKEQRGCLPAVPVGLVIVDHAESFPSLQNRSQSSPRLASSFPEPSLILVSGNRLGGGVAVSSRG